MSPRLPRRTNRGFTLSELLIGMSLAMVVMLAVLTSYIFLGRQLVKLTNEQTLETESRRALGYFSRDVQQASGISGTPSATSLTLVIPTSNGSVGTVAYTYDSSAGTLTRTPSTGTAIVLARNITTNTLAFSYYDEQGNPYTSYTNYLNGIKQLAITYTCQTGNVLTGTRTKSRQIASARLILRNRYLLQ